MWTVKHLAQLREDLEDFFYHEPARLDNIMAKLRIVNNKLREKLAKARHLVYCIENGCDICYPDDGVLFNDE